MFQAFANIFKVPELRRRVFFTLGMLAIYRLGFVIPLVGVNPEEIAKAVQNTDDSTGFGRIAQYASIFSGGGGG